MEVFGLDFKSISVLVIGLISVGSAMAAAFSDSRVVSTALESMARQPEIQGALRTSMIIGIGLVESIPIIAIVIAFMLFGKL
jgi:F-type H+-transporting ATPase subunit c